MRTRRYILFAAASVGLTLLLSMTVLLAADLYLHQRYEFDGGWNVWGYRGPVVGAKQAGTTRVVVTGGSTALGYGVPWPLSFPKMLEDRLNQATPRRFEVVNLAFNNHGAYSFLHTLTDYEYLQYDIAILYEGYNDLGGPNTAATRRQSLAFRAVGYLPILPIIMREKAMSLRYGGDMEAGYRGSKTVFRPTLVDRTSAAALNAAADVSRALDHQLSTFANEPAAGGGEHIPACGSRWSFYCQNVVRAVDHALERSKRILVVSQPAVSALHHNQQESLIKLLQERYGGNPRVRHVDLRATVDLRDQALCYDGVHLTGPGNELIAAALVQPVREIAASSVPNP